MLLYEASLAKKQISLGVECSDIQYWKPDFWEGFLCTPFIAVLEEGSKFVVQMIAALLKVIWPQSQLLS